MTTHAFPSTFVSALVLSLALATGTPAQDHCVDFDGVTGYGIHGESAPIQGSTWEAWIYVGDIDPTATIPGWVVGWWGWWTASPYRVTANGELFGPGGYGNPGSDVVLANLAPDSWHHLAATFGGECSPSVDVYLDGQLAMSYDIGTECPSSWYTVLAAYNYLGWNGFYKGRIDEVRISSSSRYNGNFVPQTRYSVDADTWALWHFDEGVGTQAVDEVAGRVFSLNGGYGWSVGVGSDCDGDGTPDSDQISAGAADCDGDGVLDSCQLAGDLSLDWNGDGVLDSCSSANYCASKANSTGEVSTMSAHGSPAIADAAFTLVGSNVPAGELGYFLMSQSSDLMTPFGSGAGVLCLGTPIVRMNQASDGGAILIADLNGQMSFTPDLGALPQGSMLAPGDVWYFQLWYQDTDPVLQIPTSNSSDGIEVMFR